MGTSYCSAYMLETCLLFPFKLWHTTRIFFFVAIYKFNVVRWDIRIQRCKQKQRPSKWFLQNIAFFFASLARMENTFLRHPIFKFAVAAFCTPWPCLKSLIAVIQNHTSMLQGSKSCHGLSCDIDPSKVALLPGRIFVISSQKKKRFLFHEHPNSKIANSETYK